MVRITRDHGELGDKFTLVDVQVCAADAAGFDFDLCKHTVSPICVHTFLEEKDTPKYHSHEAKGEEFRLYYALLASRTCNCQSHLY